MGGAVTVVWTLLIIYFVWQWQKEHQDEDRQFRDFIENRLRRGNVSSGRRY